MPTEVVPDADAVEVFTPDEGGTSGEPLAEGPLAGGPLAGGPVTGGTPVCAGGPGGTTVAVLTGGPLAGGVAIDSTELAGRAGEDASWEGMVGVLMGMETAGGVLTGTPAVVHTVSVTVTVTGEAHAAAEKVKIDYTSVISFTHCHDSGRRRCRPSLQRREP